LFRYEADEFNGGFGKVPEDGFGSLATGPNQQQASECLLCPASDGRPEKGGLSLRANSSLSRCGKPTNHFAV